MPNSISNIDGGAGFGSALFRGISSLAQPDRARVGPVRADLLQAQVKSESARVAGEVVDASVQRSAELREERERLEERREIQNDRQRRAAERELIERESAQETAERLQAWAKSAAERTAREDDVERSRVQAADARKDLRALGENLDVLG